MVAYGDLMGIPAQVFDHLGRAIKRPLAVYYPVLCKKGIIEIRRQIEPFSQARNEPGPEHLGHGLNREQVFPPAARILPLAPGRDPATGDDAVQMRMERQVLAPGVQDGDHTGIRPEELGAVPKVPDHGPRRPEKQAVHFPGRVQAGPVQLMGQGEHYMEVRYVQQLFLPRPYPRFPLMALALGTMPVTATVIAQVQAMAGRIVAAVDVSAKGRGTAFAKGVQRPCPPTVGANAR